MSKISEFSTSQSFNQNDLVPIVQLEQSILQNKKATLESLSKHFRKDSVILLTLPNENIGGFTINALYDTEQKEYQGLNTYQFENTIGEKVILSSNQCYQVAVSLKKEIFYNGINAIASYYSCPIAVTTFANRLSSFEEEVVDEQVFTVDFDFNQILHNANNYTKLFSFKISPDMNVAKDDTITLRSVISVLGIKNDTNSQPGIAIGEEVMEIAFRDARGGNFVDETASNQFNFKLTKNGN